MKKVWLCFCTEADVLKILLKMKLTIIISLLTIFSCYATENNAQGSKVSLELKNSSVKEILIFFGQRQPSHYKKI